MDEEDWHDLAYSGVIGLSIGILFGLMISEYSK
jgi:hypothetical protein